MKHLVFVMLLSLAASASAATPETATQAVNAFGLDLHRQMPSSGNVCLSPYSIQSALGMTYLGASGVTQEEMARVLHFPADKTALGESFAALHAALEEAQTNSAKQVAQSKKYGGPTEALKLHVANRLFGQKSYEFRKTFLSGVKSHFGAPMEFLNFITDQEGSTRKINGWVEKQTQKRIRDLIPENGLSVGG
ncbi:MAG: serpin family protein [Verrucomicrobiales bacterium]